MFSGLIDPRNTASDLWADSAYRSARNEEFLTESGLLSRIHHRKPWGRPMSKRTRQANKRKATIRARVEHVFAEQKHRMGLVVRTIGIARAKAAVTLANMAYNMKRWVWWEAKAKTP